MNYEDKTSNLLFLLHIMTKKRRVLVVGDYILDRYITGTTSKISPEAPVPVITGNLKTYERNGGAGNVADTITSLGGSVSLYSLTDRVGNVPIKTRIICNNHHKV